MQELDGASLSSSFRDAQASPRWAGEEREHPPARSQGTRCPALMPRTRFSWYPWDLQHHLQLSPPPSAELIKPKWPLFASRPGALFAALCRTFVSSKERNLDHRGGIQTLVKKSRVFFPRGKQLNSSVPLAPLPWEPFGPSSLPQLLSIFQISWWKRRLGLDTPN